MRPGRFEALSGVLFIGLTLGWTFMGVHQHNAAYADMTSALGAVGGASLGAALVAARERLRRR